MGKLFFKCNVNLFFLFFLGDCLKYVAAYASPHLRHRVLRCCQYFVALSVATKCTRGLFLKKQPSAPTPPVAFTRGAQLKLSLSCKKSTVLANNRAYENCVTGKYSLFSTYEKGYTRISRFVFTFYLNTVVSSKKVGFCSVERINTN